MRELPDGMRVHLAPQLRKAPWQAAAAIRRATETVHLPVVVHSHQHRADFAAAWLRVRTGIPHLLISTVHARLRADLPWQSAPVKRLVYEPLARWALNHVDLVFTVSHATARHIEEDLLLSPSKIVALKNAIDLTELDGVTRRDAVRAGLGRRSNRSVVVAVGRLEHRKGQHVLLQALARIPALQQPDLWLVGTGPAEAALRRMASATGLGERVTFLGQRNDVPVILKAADIYVQPSLWDPLPRSLLEAMASNLPCIASATDGIPEVVLEGKTGWLVPPGDPDLLAAQLTFVLEHKDLALECANAARQLVQRNHTMDHMAKDILGVLQSYASPVRP